MTAVLVPVQKLKKLCNPFLDHPWEQDDGEASRVSQELVRQALSNRQFVACPYSTPSETALTQWSGYMHAARIAWLVDNWDRPNENAPIEIDVGVPALHNHLPLNRMIIDGHHRLAAAIYRKERFIKANISGQVDYAEKLFGITFPKERELLIKPDKPLFDVEKARTFDWVFSPNQYFQELKFIPVDSPRFVAKVIKPVETNPEEGGIWFLGS